MCISPKMWKNLIILLPPPQPLLLITTDPYHVGTILSDITTVIVGQGSTRQTMQITNRYEWR